MASNEIQNPFDYFRDVEGNALDAGNIYIGTFGLDAELNPQPVFTDAALTIPIVQPIRTSFGVPYVSGAPVNIYTNGSYSIKVTQLNGVLVYSANVQGSTIASGSAQLSRTTEDMQRAFDDLENGQSFWSDGLSYQKDDSIPLSLSATEDLGIAGIKPFPGTERPEHFGGTDAAAMLRCFDYVGSSGGGVIHFGIARYESPYKAPAGQGYFNQPPLMLHDNITLAGEKLPTFNATDTALENGSIIEGSFFYAANNLNWHNIGIDVGADFCGTYNAGDPMEGFVSIDRGNAGYPGFTPTGVTEDPPRTGGKSRGDIVVLCKGTGRPVGYWGGGDLGDVSDIHAMLLENENDSVAYGVMHTRLGGAGWVLKGSRNKYRVLVEFCYKYGQGLLKSEDYSSANDNTITFLRTSTEVPDPLDVTDATQYQYNAMRLEAATADCVGNTIIHEGCRGLVNGIELLALAGQSILRNRIHCVGEIDTVKDYPVLTNGAGVIDNTNEILGLKSHGAFRGILVRANHSLRLVQPDVSGSRQFSYLVEAGGVMDLVAPRSDLSWTPSGFAHYSAPAGGIINIIGRSEEIGGPALTSGAGTFNGANDGTGLLIVPGENVVEDGDAESIDGWEEVNTTATVVPGGFVGNAIEVSRDGAAAGYFRQQLTLVTGKKYSGSIRYQNGSGTARLFLSRNTFADGFYSGGTFITLNSVGWTQVFFEFVATGPVAFITFQNGSVAPGTFRIDEIELRAEPLSALGGAYFAGAIGAETQEFADNASALAGGLSVGTFYAVTGSNPRTLAVVF